MGDVQILKDVCIGQVELINWVSTHVLKINKVYNKHTIPTTRGKLVADLFEEFIFNQKLTLNGQNVDTRFLIGALAKLGILNSYNDKSRN